MSDQQQEDEILDLTEDHEVEQDDDQQQDDAEGGDNEQEEDYLQFDGDDPEPEQETDLVRHLRQQIRERDKQLHASRKAPQAEQLIEVGARPTLESCDYDSERFEQEFDAWVERGEQRRQQDQRLEAAQREQAQQWEQVKTGYATAKAKLPFADKEQAEATAFDSLSEVQQAVIAKYADNPALVIYAAGKNPTRLASLAGIEDPLKLAKEIGKLEATMKVTKRARPPQPDRAVRGSAISASTTDKREKQLEDEADRTGDRTKLIQYRRERRQASA